MMLISLWEIVNIDTRMANGSVSLQDSNIASRRQNAINNFHQVSLNSYSQLGLLGLYFGTEVVEPIAQLQSDLTDMVNNQDYAQLRDWGNFRRIRLLPILQRVHDELKETVFPKAKSFRIILD